MSRYVTVLMATYNGEKYLDEQIESLLNQENVKVNILVRDDSSTDNTQNLLNKWQDKGAIKWYTGERLNAKKSFLNLMLTAASSYDTEYYAFCDQDDVWDKDKLSIALNRLEKFPNNKPALYYSGQRLVDSSLNLLEEHKLNKYRNFQTRFVISDIAGCTAVYNKNLLNLINMYNPTNIRMHDTWMYKVCVSVGGNIVIDPECRLNYRQHGNNVVGLDGSLKGKISRFKYVYNAKISQEMVEIYEYYGNMMTQEYKTLAKAICNYGKDKELKKILLDKKYINFHNKGLNLAFRLKVLNKKL